MSTSTIATVLHQHAEGASSLWLRRAQAVAQPHFRLADLAKLDRRLEAHLDGLRIAGNDGWQCCKDELRWKGPGEVFAAAVIALQSGDRNRIAEVVAVAATEPDAAVGLTSALGWLEPAEAEGHFERFRIDTSPALRRVAIAAAAIHRRELGVRWSETLADDDPMTRARGMRALGELGRVDLVERARLEMRSEHAAVGFWAAWSAALLTADPTALEVLRAVAARAGSWQERALDMSLRRSVAANARAWHEELWRTSSPPRIALRAAAVLGIPEPVDRLIDLMAAPLTARLAGEAFSMITGVDIAYLGLDRPRPEGFQSGPSEDPADENVEMDPDENLPWPDRDKIAAWWKKHESEFTPGTRYLLGKPITEDWLEHVLRHGYQRQRAAAALELAIRRPGTPLFEVRAPGFRQQELLG